jgi:hypothetical protein
VLALYAESIHWGAAWTDKERLDYLGCFARRIVF